MGVSSVHFQPIRKLDSKAPEWVPANTTIFCQPDASQTHCTSPTNSGHTYALFLSPLSHGRPCHPSHLVSVNPNSLIGFEARYRTLIGCRLETKIDLDKLPYAKGAMYNSYGDDHITCHPATRVNLLHEIYDWARQDSPVANSIPRHITGIIALIIDLSVYH